MKAVLASLVFAVGALAQSFTINTPTNAVVCQPLLLTWSGGTPPYFLYYSVLPGDQPNGAALVDLGQQAGTSVTWLVNQPQGSSIGLTLRDSNGQVAQSAAFTVNGGTDTSCVGKNPSSSSGAPATTGGSTSPATAGATTTPGTTPATTPGTTPGTTPATTPAGTTPAGTTSRPATASTSSRSTAASSAAASTTSNAASANFASVGTAGVIGAALAALLV